jgi:site-specific DNA recombinase
MFAASNQGALTSMDIENDASETRILAALRLSRDTDESTSIERQREQVRAWARSRDSASVVGEAVDSDVSGTVPAMEREGLGPYLREPLASTWEVLVVSKLDRLTRNVADFMAVVDWANQHGKVIVSLVESFDLGTPYGRFVATIMAAFAEMERERIRERCRESYARLRGTGRGAAGRHRTDTR